METENKNTFQLRRLMKEDVYQVAHLLAEIYSQSEPVSIHYKEVFGETVEDVYKTYALPETESCIEDDMSFVVVDETLPAENQIIGFALCRKLTLSDEKPECDLTLQEAFDLLLNKCNSEYLKLYPNTKCTDHAQGIAIGVKDGYQGNSLALKLINAGIQRATAKGYKYLFLAPTSPKFAHICKSVVNMKKVLSLPFADIEFNGVKYFEGIKGISNFEYFQLDLSENKTEIKS